MLTDGNRWAAFEPARGTTRITDARTGRTVQRPDPTGCEGRLVAVGGGELLYRCDVAQCPADETRIAPDACVPADGSPTYATVRYVLEDAATGAVHPIVGADRLAMGTDGTASFPALENVGARWVQGIGGAYHSASVFFIDWHTGRMVSAEPNGGPYAVDLDQPEVLAPQCSDLGAAQSALQDVDLYGTTFAPFTADTRFALNNDLRAPSKPELRQCGSRRSVVLDGPLSHHYPQAGTPQLGGGIATWAVSMPYGGMRAYATRLDAHRGQWHRGISSYRGRAPALLNHTSTRIYDSAGDPTGGPNTFEISSAKLSGI